MHFGMIISSSVRDFDNNSMIINKYSDSPLIKISCDFTPICRNYLNIKVRVFLFNDSLCFLPYHSNYLFEFDHILSINLRNLFDVNPNGI